MVGFLRQVQYCFGVNGEPKITATASLSRTLRLARSKRFTEPKTNSTLIAPIRVLQHASCLEIYCFIFGCVTALVNGICGWPVLLYFTAEFAQELSNILMKTRPNRQEIPMNTSQQVDLENHNNFSSETEWENAIQNFTFPAVICGIVVLLTGYLFVFILNFTAERIVLRVKKLYVASVLKQNMSWFDTKTQGELISTVSRSLGSVETALGDKLGLFLSSVSEVTASLAICFWSGWQLSLILLCLYPILIATGKLGIMLQVRMNKVIGILNADLTGLVQEVLGGIRTVFAFSGENMELDRFTNRLKVSRRMNVKQGVVSGINFSLVLPITQCFIAVGTWYGIKLIVQTDVVVLNPETHYNVKNVVLIVLMVMLSGFLTRQAVHLYEVLNAGFRAATAIINVIERKQDIDSSNCKGKILHFLKGDINFNQVYFKFPLADETTVIQALNLHVKAGETIALVGPSGGGKSTILQLILRFYDPQEGEISIDGVPLQEFNLGWYRSNIGVVNQEPHLFNATIRENIRYGNGNASEEDIIRFAKEANAHDFILKLPEQYDTVIGEQGSLLSGGQRQRIAIARALIRNPAILLLDEATSALDHESETKIQETLDRVRGGRTVIIIAHRLSTIRTVDRIVGIKEGNVVEQGTHKELIEKKGLYYHLIQAEQTSEGKEGGDKQEDIDRNGETKLKLNSVENDHVVAVNDKKLPNKSEMRKSLWKMLQFCRSDCLILTGVIFFAALHAGCLPARAFAFGNLLNLIVDRSNHENNHSLSFWPGMYVFTGICVFITQAMKIWMQSEAEENLLVRIRRRMLSAIFQQEVGWFDEPAQSIGNLCSLVMIDAENVKKIPGAMIGSWVYTCVAMTTMVAFSMWVQWKLTLAVSVMSISIFISYYIKQRVEREILVRKSVVDTRANNIAIEALRNFRTVVSLHIQHMICRRFDTSLIQRNGLTNKRAHIRAFTVASSDAFSILGTTVAFAYGGYLMSSNQVTYAGFMMINALLVNNMLEVSFAFAAMPSCSKACISAQRILRLFARKPLIANSELAHTQLPTVMNPRIEFNDVSFSYPTRPDDKILNHLNLVVDSGENVAFVGASGCGKSTCLQLLQRFYDPIDGKVTLNGLDIRSLNVSFLRSLIGHVSQDPVLFSRTIGENIAYGNNERKIEMHEIIDAARKANIHEFITSLQQGYDTLIGARGVELSGGQKQRVAIARALVKNPQILLLDEATSALDNESQKAVQQSLDKAQKGRTCIIVAHRLSTIQNAQKIVVFSRGQVEEMATKGTNIEVLLRSKL